MLPRSSVIRKINDLVKRARLVKVHAHIVAHLRAQMPAMFGGDTKKEELLATMGEVFKTVAKNHALTSGDFPSASEYRTKFKRDDFYKFQPLHPKLIGAMEQVGIPIKLSTHSLYLSIYLYIYIYIPIQLSTDWRTDGAGAAHRHPGADGDAAGRSCVCVRGGGGESEQIHDHANLR